MLLYYGADITATNYHFYFQCQHGLPFKNNN